MIPFTKPIIINEHQPDIKVERYPFDDWYEKQISNLKKFPWLTDGDQKIYLDDLNKRYEEKRELYQLVHKNINKLFEDFYSMKLNEETLNRIKMSFINILNFIRYEEKLNDELPEVHIFDDKADGHLRIVFMKYSPEWEKVLIDMELITPL